MSSKDDIRSLKVKLEEIQAQLQSQSQSQAQNDTDTISNIGNPNVNINISNVADGDDTVGEASKLVEFKFDIQNSVNPTGEQPGTLLTAETTVADVTLDDVKAGNEVLLQGLFHVDNDSNAVQTLRVRIYKNAVAAANVIYDTGSNIEIDSENRDDQNQPIPVLHVDDIGADATNVRYILTAQGNTLLLKGPITFTASEIIG